MRAAFALRIISGKIIYNFGVLKSLRAFQNPFFTSGVLMENGSCPSSGATRHLPPAGEGFSGSSKVSGSTAKFAGVPLPLGGAVAQRLRGF